MKKYYEGITSFLICCKKCGVKNDREAVCLVCYLCKNCNTDHSCCFNSFTVNNMVYGIGGHFLTIHVGVPLGSFMPNERDLSILSSVMRTAVNEWFKARSKKGDKM